MGCGPTKFGVLPVKYKFIKTTFIKKSNFIKIHFHQKPISSKSNFIKNQFHQKTVSSKNSFIHVDTFIKTHFSAMWTLFIKNHFSSKNIFITHQIGSWDRTKHDWDGKNNIVRISVKASPAEGRRRFHRKNSLCQAFRVSTGLHVEHRRPMAGDAPHEGLLKVERRGFKCLGV